MKNLSFNLICFSEKKLRLISILFWIITSCQSFEGALREWRKHTSDQLWDRTLPNFRRNHRYCRWKLPRQVCFCQIASLLSLLSRETKAYFIGNPVRKCDLKQLSVFYPRFKNNNWRSSSEKTIFLIWPRHRKLQFNDESL